MRANLFITALDEERNWYRYHQLFADVLRSRVRQPYPVRVSELHRHAAGWFELHGTASEAISHALAGGDQDHAARLVEQQAMSLLMPGEMLALLNWLHAAEAVAQTHPGLLVVKAWAVILTGQMAPAVAVLQQIDQFVAGVAAVDRPALNARWMYGNNYRGPGNATGGPKEGFAGRYHVRYFYDSGEFSDEYDLVIEKTGDAYEVSWITGGKISAVRVCMEVEGGLAVGWRRVGD